MCNLVMPNTTIQGLCLQVTLDMTLLLWGGIMPREFLHSYVDAISACEKGQAPKVALQRQGIKPTRFSIEVERALELFFVMV